MPVVLSSAILAVRPPFIWMGGGHPQLKLGVAIAEFVSALEPIVGDCSSER